MEPVPEDWQRGLVIAAHPDDIEYGPAAAVARWTDQGKDVRYVLATSGEAGIAGMPPSETAPLREREELDSAAIVGVTQVEFLELPDGRLEEGLALRRILAEAIRRHRPELVVTPHFGPVWAPGYLNSADHRVLGRAVLDAVADAGNEWIFPELAEQEPWGARWCAVMSPHCSHAVDVAATFERAVESLSCHRRYLEVLDPATPVQTQARNQMDRATAAKDGFDAERAVGFELYWFRG